VVWFGERITRRVPIRVVHVISAVIFAVLGVIALLVSTQNRNVPFSTK
jgi:putative Ca2+/H+ antiporter (TMEM165/GDT1 family)